MPTGHGKKSRKFCQIPKKSARICAMTVMKDTYPKRKFKPHRMGLLKEDLFGNLATLMDGLSQDNLNCVI